MRGSLRGPSLGGMSDSRAGLRRGNRPVLVVQHEDERPPAWLGGWLESAGDRLDVRRPYAGDPLPEGLGDHSGVLVLGGPMGAGDDAEHHGLAPTRRLPRTACECGVPTLGVCLGHQLLAAATGGRVGARPRGRECALLPVGWTTEAAGDPLFGPLARSGGYDRPVAVQWNQDLVVELPPAATALAYSADSDLQVIRVAAAAWGIQAHPEAGTAVVATWLRQHPDEVPAPERALLADLTAATEAGRLRSAWEPLATGFARLCGLLPCRGRSPGASGDPSLQGVR